MTTPNKLEIPDEVRRKHKMMAIAEFWRLSMVAALGAVS
jgi:hypothetical protein